MNTTGLMNFNNGQRTIIIKSDDFSIFIGLRNVYSYYSSYRLYARAFRKIVRKCRLYFAYPFFYGCWKKDLKNIETVILFDVGINNIKKLTQYVKRVNPKIRLIFWYWNPVKPADVVLDDSNIDEIWTYDRFDAKKYNLKYNPQFYRKILIGKKDNTYIDMIFVGTDKGREKTLADLKKDSLALGLKCKFVLAKGKEDRIGYKDYLRDLVNSRCVVDIVPNQQCGLTLRPLEALFYKKKLITNYEDIVNYDFYDKENIFILGKDNINKLADFVNSPYKEVDEKIVDFYSYENWLKRIENDESVKP